MPIKAVLFDMFDTLMMIRKNHEFYSPAFNENVHVPGQKRRKCLLHLKRSRKHTSKLETTSMSKLMLIWRSRISTCGFLKR